VSRVDHSDIQLLQPQIALQTNLGDILSEVDEEACDREEAMAGDMGVVVRVDQNAMTGKVQQEEVFEVDSRSKDQLLNNV
jgi:hypothetical protein